MTDMQATHSATEDRWRLRRLTRSAFEKRTYTGWGYLLAGLPLGVLWFSLLVPLYITGTVLIVIWIGLGWLALTQVLSRWIGLFERWLARISLGAAIAKPAAVEGETLYERGRAHLTDEFGYRVLLWSIVRLIMGTLGFVLAVVAFVVPIALLLAPVSYGWMAAPGSWAWTLWVAPLLGVPAFFAAPYLIRALGKANTKLAEWVLGSFESERPTEASLRAERAEEQLRIDQELHDSIGHVLTMNVVQAGAGAHVFDQDPEFAREALTNIERRGREALYELDRIIALVRSGEISREPLPAIDDIERLVAEAREAGMEIESRIETVSAPPEIGRATYRIVQEALTNVAKHSPGANTRLTVAPVRNRLEIEVVNLPPLDGGRRSTTGTGSGLSGLHQRVTILGGRSDSGPTADGGFRVTVSFPLDEAEVS